MHFTPEPTVDITSAFGEEVLQYIPFCRGKQFGGSARWTNVLGFAAACTVVFINDDVHHSDDLHVLFSLPGGSFYFQKAAYDHEINQCVELLELAFGTPHSDVDHCANGDVAMVFKGVAPLARQRILDDNRKNMLSSV
jgi:hypothetical protein